QNANEILAHLPGNVRQHLMLVLQFNPEHRIRQRFQHRCHDFNRVFFTHSLLTQRDVACNVSSRHTFLVTRPARRSKLRLYESYRVSITGPSLVTATQCSKWALKLPSAVTAVHLSSRTRVSGLPEFTIGSIAITIPSRNRAPCPRFPKFGTCGSSCNR